MTQRVIVGTTRARSLHAAAIAELAVANDRPAPAPGPRQTLPDPSKTHGMGTTPQLRLSSAVIFMANQTTRLHQCEEDASTKGQASDHSHESAASMQRTACLVRTRHSGSYDLIHGLQRLLLNRRPLARVGLEKSRTRCPSRVPLQKLSEQTWAANIHVDVAVYKLARQGNLFRLVRCNGPHWALAIDPQASKNET